MENLQRHGTRYYNINALPWSYRRNASERMKQKKHKILADSRRKVHVWTLKARWWEVLLVFKPSWRQLVPPNPPLFHIPHRCVAWLPLLIGIFRRKKEKEEH